MKLTGIPIVIGAQKTIPMGIDKWIKRRRNQGTRREHSSDNIIKIGENTENRPADLKRLAATQTPVKDHYPTLV